MIVGRTMWTRSTSVTDGCLRSAESTDYVLPRLRTKFAERSFSYMRDQPRGTAYRVDPQNIVPSSLQATIKDTLIF